MSALRKALIIYLIAIFPVLAYFASLYFPVPMVWVMVLGWAVALLIIVPFEDMAKNSFGVDLINNEFIDRPTFYGLIFAYAVYLIALFSVLIIIKLYSLQKRKKQIQNTIFTNSTTVNSDIQ